MWPDMRGKDLLLGVFVVLTIVLASSAAVEYSQARTITITNISTTTVTSTVTTAVSHANLNAGPSVYSSGVSSSGLQLTVKLNSSSIQLHGEIAVQIELLNVLDHNNSLVVTTNQNISRWNEEDFFCGENPSHSLVGFALFKGHFSAGNISAAGSPLQLAAPVALPCPFSLNLNGTTFLPNSDKTMSFSYYGQTQEPSYPVTAEVNATTGYCVNSPSSISCPGSSGVLGYWTPGFRYAGNMTLTSKSFSHFPLGEYTIVATDDWNQFVYAYFTVL
jgi:hypothetical protein